MNFFNRFKGVIGIIIVVAIAFFAYSYFFKPSANEPVLTSVAPSGSSTVDQDLIGLLLTLKNIRLDDSIFSDSAFRSLQDFGKELVPEPIGRPNPFAPLGSISAQSKAGAQSSSGAPSIGAKK